MNKIFVLFFIALFYSVGYSQEAPEKMILEYLDYGKLSDKNPGTAQKKLVELIIRCKAKGYYNLASMSYSNLGHMYLKQGHYELARTTLKLGIETGKKSKEQSGTATNMGFMGWLLQSQDLNSETLGHDYISKGISLLESNKEDDEFKYMTLGKLYILQGFSKTDKPDSLKTRLYLINKALENYKKAPSKYFNKNLLLAENYINIASVQHDLKQYKEAIRSLKKAEDYNKIKISHTSERIYLGLTENHLRLQEYDSTIVYGNKALEYVDTHHENDIQLELELYSHLQNAYQNLGNREMAEKYLNLSQIIEGKINKEKLKTAGKINHESTLETQKNFQVIQVVFILLCFLFLCLLSGFIYYRRKHAKEVSAFRNFRQTLKEQQSRLDPHDEQEQEQEQEQEPKKVINQEESQEYQSKNSPTQSTRLEDAIMSSTEKQILKGLKKFENRAGFTHKGITQSKLAAQLHTNVRYLSIIIKKHKSDNFSNYINTLRINYITIKIENNILYRKYKISYLADECGYPNPSSFTKAFSEVTGITPSSYISLLTAEEEQNELK